MRARMISLFLAIGVLMNGFHLALASGIAGESEIKKAPIIISLDRAIELMKAKNPDIRLQEIAVERATEEVKLDSCLLAGY